MPKFIIERDIPDAGKLTEQQLKETSDNSCCVLRNLGPKIQWVESYVTANKVYCVYIAPDAEMIRKHAEELGLPANEINQVTSIIDPTTAD